MSFFKHESCFVDEQCEIGDGTKIWHYSHIMPFAKIGSNCVLGQNVCIASQVTIGNCVKIQNNVSVYTGTEIEDNVFLGPSVVLTNVTNPRSEINRHSIYERILIRRGATVGANATIVCGVTIGRYAFVGAGAVVTKDIPDYGYFLGVPARQCGWMSRHGHVLQTGINGIMVCPESGLRYKVNENGCIYCIDIGENEPLPESMKQGERCYDDFKGGAV